MTGRVLVTVKCPSKHHVLARLVAMPGGEIRLRIDSLAVGECGKGGRVRNARGDGADVPFTESMSYVAVCGCGHGHPVDGRALVRAYQAGESVVIARAIL